jgi:hypothetical protein
MGIGKVLGSISPLYGAVTGKGLFGKGFTAIEDATGMGGVFPKMAQAARNRDRRQAQDAEMAQREADMRAKGRAIGAKLAPGMQGNMMKKGGSVKKKPMAVKKMAKGGSASRRADGIARKGKTKGRFV